MAQHGKRFTIGNAASEIEHRNMLRGLADQRHVVIDDQDGEALRREKVAEFRERFANPFIAAERGFIDAVIEPRETRPRVIGALRMLENKVDTMPRKKHGNIPL